MLKALFNDIRRELFPSQGEEDSEKLLSYLYIDLHVFKFKDVLDNIVAIWVLNEDSCVLRYLKSECDLLHRVSAIDALLHNAAAVLVTGNLNALSDHSIINELVELRLPGE